MKQHKIVIGIVLVATLLTSCLNDFLTVEPLSTITSEVYWKTEKDARAALNSAYAHLQRTYKGGFLYWKEARADNMIGNVSGGFPVQNICLNRLNPSVSQCNWNNWYEIVSVANYSIHFIPKMTDVAEYSRNHLLSEAYFLRAYAYFHLCNIWGDVPLIIEPVLKKSEVTKPLVTSRDVVFRQVVADLDTAAVLVNPDVDELFLYSPAALYAFITEVAMWDKNWEKAIEYSQKVFDLKRHTLVGTNFADVCALATTADNIWTLKWSFASNGENSVTSSLANSANPLIPNKLIFDKWFAWEAEAGHIDLRRVATIDSSRYSRYTKNHIMALPAGSQCWKWSPGEHKAQTLYQECYIPLIRLADVILLRAEALCKVDRTVEAIAEVNKVRIRAGLSEKDEAYYADRPEKLYEDILQERQFELFAEGKRWFDLMRTERVQIVMNDYFDNYIKKYDVKGKAEYIKFTENWQLYWPVYDDILNENDNLHQIGNY